MPATNNLHVPWSFSLSVFLFDVFILYLCYILVVYECLRTCHVHGTTSLYTSLYHYIPVLLFSSSGYDYVIKTNVTTNRIGFSSRCTVKFSHVISMKTRLCRKKKIVRSVCVWYWGTQVGYSRDSEKWMKINKAEDMLQYAGGFKNGVEMLKMG